MNYEKSLNPEKALIWRIIHLDNLPWILENGQHCKNSEISDPNWVEIGSSELITKRTSHLVPIEPNGNLSDYIPFYFTPFSPMLKNIHSGRGGVKQRSNKDIVILVSSLPKLVEVSVPFVFTDSHAYYSWANYYSDLSDLDKIDWNLLQNRDFKRDPDDPAKFERYQAEALVHRYCPIDAFLGIVCYTEEVKQQLETWVTSKNLDIQVYVRPNWYFQ